MQEYPTRYELQRLAETAGRAMLKYFGQELNVTLKDDNTPLTIVDTLINKTVLEYFEQNYPHIHVVGEEGNREVADAEYTVLCDPIDGTSPYSLWIPVSAFAITVLKDGEPFLAVIHDPFLKRTWIGEKGKGTALNARPVRVSEARSLHGSNVMLVKWKGCGFNLDWVETKLGHKDAKVQNLTSLAYFGGLIASGLVEASIFPGTGLLETAAMQVIVEEAGGLVTDLFGNRIVYSREHNYRHTYGSLASNKWLHEELLKLTNPTFVPK